MTLRAHILSLGLLIASGAAASEPASSHDAAVSRNLNTFNAIVKELEMNYVDTIRPKEAFDAAVNALLSTIDPYTVYYDSEARADLTKMTTGEYDYGGIGSFIMERDGSLATNVPMESASGPEKSTVLRLPLR